VSTRHRLIQVGPFGGSPTADERLKKHYDVIELWRFSDRDAALAQVAQGVTTLVTSASRGCDAALIAALPDLKAICSWGVGYETIDIAAAHARGIQVSNTPDVLTDCVADLAWGLLIAGARRIAQGDSFVRAGRWGLPQQSLPLSTRVSGKKLGIVGLGRIGLAIAKRAAGFDMDVRYHGRHPRAEAPYVYEASLTDLASWADFLVVATPGGAATHHLISRDVLEALGPKGVLVNIARGPVVDESALVQALQTGALGSAALDVFEHEPKVPEALRKIENTVLLPHVGSATVETRQAMEDLLFENLEAYIRTGKVVTPVQ
jgi:lactate dehydrogenase-like 2-hydroxyacid dehydrogenase